MKKTTLLILVGALALTASPAHARLSASKKQTFVAAFAASSIIGLSTYYLYGSREAPRLNQYSLNEAAEIVDKDWGAAIQKMQVVNKEIDNASMALALNKQASAAAYYFEAAQLTEEIADTYRDSIEKMLLLQLDSQETLGENGDFRKALLMACSIACKSYDSASTMYRASGKPLMAEKMRKTKECIHRPGEKHDSPLSPQELRADLLAKINLSRVHDYTDAAKLEKTLPAKELDQAYTQKIEKFNLDTHELQKENIVLHFRDEF